MYKKVDVAARGLSSLWTPRAARGCEWAGECHTISRNARATSRPTRSRNPDPLPTTHTRHTHVGEKRIRKWVNVDDRVTQAETGLETMARKGNIECDAMML